MAPDSRATAPVVGVVVLVGVTVLLAATVGAFALDHSGGRASSTPAPVALSLSASADGTVVVEHGPGPPLDVRDLRVRVRVDGEPLRHQPPVPFFAARGFVSGPTGPFNVATDPMWTAGERASFSIAASNSPGIDAGNRIEVRIAERGGGVFVLEALVE